MSQVLSDSQIPTLPGRGVLGYLNVLAADPLNVLMDIGHTHGDLVRFRMVNTYYYLVNSPEFIHTIHKDSRFVRSDRARKVMESMLGHGLFSQEGSQHLTQRRLMQPAFAKSRYDQYIQIMEREVERATANWKDGQTVELSKFFQDLTLRVVCNTLFFEAEAQHPDFAKAIITAQDAAVNQFRLRALLPKWFPFRYYAQQKKAVDLFQSVTDQVVKARLKAPEDHGDLLSMLILARDEEGKGLTESEISAQARSLIFAGHETTAMAMKAVTYLLFQHPESLARLQEELDGQDTGVSVAALQGLKYTDAVVQESLRLYPPAHFTERTPTEDVELGGHLLKAGTPLMISVYVTHRDERFFEQPSRFMPERFTPDTDIRTDKRAFLPFGAGLHQCIGNIFAQLEMRVLVRHLFQRFTFTLPEDYALKPAALITLGVLGEMPATVHRRKP